MFPALIWALPAALCTTDASQSRVPATDAVAVVATADSIESVFGRGQRWQEFYAAVDRRREVWERNWTTARIPDSLAARARAVGRLRILVITEPGCSDSANSIPFLARLVEAAPELDMRLVNSSVGRSWMEAHRTPDGRAATPTILVLDDEFRIRGCWVEQPKALQDWWLPALKDGSARFEAKMSWYLNDEGREILRELVEMLEGARSETAVSCTRA
jgi:hypothetical protein